MLFNEPFDRLPDVRLAEEWSVLAQTKITVLNHSPHLIGAVPIYLDGEVGQQEQVGTVWYESNLIMKLEPGTWEFGELTQLYSKPFELLSRDKSIANLDTFSLGPSPSGIDHLTDQVVDTSVEYLIILKFLGSKTRRSVAPTDHRCGQGDVRALSMAGHAAGFQGDCFTAFR